VSSQFHASATSPLWKNPTNHGTEGLMGPKAGLGNEPLIIQATAQPIYWLG